MNRYEAHDQAAAMIAELKQARILLGLSGVEAAHRAGLARNIVYTSEYAISQPRMTTFIQWADSLGFDVLLVKRGGL